MSDVTFTLDADEAKAVRGFLKVVDAEKKTEHGMRKIGREAKKTQTSMQTMGASGKRALGGIADALVGAVSVGAAIATVREAWQLWDQEMKETAQKFGAFTKDFMQVMSGAGDIFRAGEVRAGIEKIQGKYPTASFQQLRETYGSVRGALPRGDLSDVLKITEQAARSELAGETPKAFGAQVGELRKLFPGKSVDDISDIAKSIREQGGKSADKLLSQRGLKPIFQWQAAGLGSAEQGLGFVLAAMERGQTPDTVSQLISKLTEEKTIPAGSGSPFGGEGDPNKAILRKFYKLDPQGRMAMLRESDEARKAVLGTQAAAVGAIFEGRPGEFTKSIKEAQTTDLFEKSVRAGLKDPAYARRMATEASEGKMERLFYEQAEFAEFRDIGSKVLKAELKREGVGPLRRKLAGAEYGVRTWFQEPGEAARETYEMHSPEAYAEWKPFGGRVPEPRIPPSIGALSGQGMTSERVEQLLQQLLNATKENTQAVRETGMLGAGRQAGILD